MDEIQLLQIDAFADSAFQGNPAAVCLLDSAIDNSDWMQHFATEMNLSETAYVWPMGSNEFSLRWFTPAAEVDLCGHATLASAHALWSTKLVPSDSEIHFRTRSGILTVSTDGKWLTMNFPARPGDTVEPPEGLFEALGLCEPYPAKGQVKANGMDYLVELANEEAVRNLEPDFRRLAKVEARGVIVTALSDGSEQDFVSRFFGPRVAVDEDPVTGSAHCFLGPYWSEKLGKTELVGFQASRRGGTVRLSVAGERVLLRGKALTIFSGLISKAALPK